MFVKLISFLAAILYLSSPALAVEFNAETYLKLVSTLCVPNLPSDKAKLITECEALVPKPVHDLYHACIRESFAVTIIDFPIFCYKARADGEKLQACMKGREAELAAHGIVFQQKTKDEFRENYMGCMVKAI